MNRKPKIDPQKDGNSIDFVSMHLMRQHFIDKKLFEARTNQPTVLYLGKLMILENILAYKLVHVLTALQNQINAKLISKRIQIKVDDPIGLLSSNATLGTLILYIEKISPKNPNLKALQKFNLDRNLLTHYMHLGFSNTREITLRARSLSLRAEKLITSLEAYRKNITPPFKLSRIPKVIDISKLIAFEKERASAIYPNPEKVEDNLKKFNKKKR